MNETIRFFINEETLTMAVRHCLYFQIEPSFYEKYIIMQSYVVGIHSNKQIV